VTTFAVQASHLTYDPQARLVYATVGGSAPSYPNTVVSIDPTTNAVVGSVPIGSNPDSLALSGDSSTLWVGLDGAEAMRKLTLGTSPVAGPLVHTSANTAFGPLMVLPGSATSVVASVGSTVAIFDDGVPRANTSTSVTALAAGPAGLVFGIGQQGLGLLQVSASGLARAPYGGLDGAGTIIYSNGRLYGSTGVVMDVTNLATPTRLGQFAHAGPIALRSNQHLLMLTIDNTVQNPPPTLRMYAMDDSFAQTAAVALPSSLSQTSPTLYYDLVYAGADAAAFIVEPTSVGATNSVAIVHAPFVASETSGAGGGGGAGGAGGIGGAGGSTVTLVPVVSSSLDSPTKLTSGPDGNLWVTEGGRIGRMTMSGVATDFLIPTAGADSWFITTGPDGNLWFTENVAHRVGRLTTAGAFTEFAAPGVDLAGITAGPDGALWFAERASGRICRMTTDGATNEFPMPTFTSMPFGIAAGPDGNLWVTESNAAKVARLTTAGVFTEFTISAGGAGAAITAGPDGNLWFVQPNAGGVCRLTTAGAITCFTVPPPTSGVPVELMGITVGHDQNLWVAAFAQSSIWRVTPAGAITAFPGASAQDIAAGSDGNLWLATTGGTAGLTRVTP
jgi:streptogramin lyase